MAVSGCMVSFSDVEALLETEKVVDQQQAKASDATEGALAASAATEKEEATLQQQEQQHDDKAAPVVPDHQQVISAPDADAAEAPAPEEHAAAAEAPGPEEHGDDEKADQAVAAAADDGQEESTRERLKRHRREMAGRVWVPEKWGQEKLLKDWVDCAVFDRPMVPTGLLTARRALIAECGTTTRRPADRRTSPSSSTTGSSPPPLRVPNGCS